MSAHLQSDVQATPAGQPLGLLHRRTGDARGCVIDCTQLLARHELMLEVLKATAPGLDVGPARTRSGTHLEVTLSGGEVPEGRPHADLQLGARVRTTRGVIDIRVGVRVHR